MKVTQSILINAPIESIWDALTNPKTMKIYLFGSDVITDWKVGHPIIFKGNWHGIPYEDKGKVLRNVTHKLLQYTYWSGALGLPDLPENYTITTYELKAENGQIFLTASQDNLDGQSERVRNNAENYWTGILKTIKDLVEKQNLHQ